MENQDIIGFHECQSLGKYEVSPSALSFTQVNNSLIYLSRHIDFGYTLIHRLFSGPFSTAFKPKIEPKKYFSHDSAS